ncbi:MAG: glycosyltransferase family 4 protein [Gemmatimonadaceae bacterium]
MPNGWFPSIAWRFTRAWREAHAVAIPSDWSLDNVRVRNLYVQNRVPSRLSYPRDADTRVKNALARALRTAGFSPGRDVLLVQFALPYGPPVRAAARELSLPYAVQLRGDDVWVWPHRSDRAFRGFVNTVRDASLVLAVSRALIGEASRISSHAINRAAVVPNGIDVERFRPPASGTEREAFRSELGLASDEIAVLCVADLLVRKGWLELLDALEMASTSVRRLVLVAATGTMFREVDLLAEVARRAPGLRVVLRHDLEPDALARAYRASDIFCLVSHWEGMSNALLEAIACGLPAVTTAMAGHPEVITHGRDGFLVPPKSVEPIREAIEMLATDAALRSRVGKAARVRAEGIGDSRKAGRRLASLLVGITGQLDPEILAADPYATPPRRAELALAGSS